MTTKKLRLSAQLSPDATIEIRNGLPMIALRDHEGTLRLLPLSAAEAKNLGDFLMEHGYYTALEEMTL